MYNRPLHNLSAMSISWRWWQFCRYGIRWNEIHCQRPLSSILCTHIHICITKFGIDVHDRINLWLQWFHLPWSKHIFRWIIVDVAFVSGIWIWETHRMDHPDRREDILKSLFPTCGLRYKQQFVVNRRPRPKRKRCIWWMVRRKIQT